MIQMYYLLKVRNEVIICFQMLSYYMIWKTHDITYYAYMSEAQFVMPSLESLHYWGTTNENGLVHIIMRQVSPHRQLTTYVEVL